MKNSSHFRMMFLAMAALLFAPVVTHSVADPNDGKTLFTANKCNTCHSITAQSIAKTNASSKAPDLSGVGLKHQADWIRQWLRKEETINGKKHLAKFKGTDPELQTLSTWLASLKTK